jgi:glycyl-tRNA synthetase beta chain
MNALLSLVASFGLVTADNPTVQTDDLVDARKRLDALRSIRKSKNFEPLTVSFKRIRRILEKAGSLAESVHVQTDLFEGDAERTLFAAMRKAAPKVEDQKRAGRYKEALEVIASLRPDVDKFFEQVMVMTENESVKRNRLALLGELLREFSTIADFAELGGDGKN